MKSRSLAQLIILALVCTTVVCLIPFFAYNYFNLRSSFYESFANDREVTGKQASNSLSIPMYNLDILQIQEVLNGFMQNQNIETIMVRDYYPPAAVVAGIGRDHGWQPVLMAEGGAEAPGLTDRYPITFQQRVVGSLEITFSDRFIRKRLQNAIVANLATLAVLTIVLSFAMFLVLRHTVLRPLQEVERFAVAAGRQDQLEVVVDSSHFALEIAHVQSALESMLSQLRSRFEELMRSEQALRESERRLQQSKKMEAIGNLAGGIAHDFNNILGAILGYADLLLVDPDKTPKAEQYLNQIKKGGYRARDLVRQILTFSRQSQLEVSHIYVVPIIQEVVSLIRSSIPSNVDIDLRCTTEEGTVKADPIQIHQVLMNLCTNACHAMETSGGTLAISFEVLDSHPTASSEAGREGKIVHLAVRDTGCGIAPEHLDKIFDPFFTTKDQAKGTGMGLAVVYGIVLDIGGDISVHSEPGVGTVFDIYLPQSQEQVALQSVDRGDALDGGSEHILLVDDDQMLCPLTKLTLETLGYRVTACNSGQDALALLATGPSHFDLVLTDYYMPKMTGLELIHEIRKTMADIPVVLYTGFSEMVDESKVIACGGDGFAYKPVSRVQLARIIRKGLQKRCQ